MKSSALSLALVLLVYSFSATCSGVRAVKHSEKSLDTTTKQCVYSARNLLYTIPWDAVLSCPPAISVDRSGYVCEVLTR